MSEFQYPTSKFFNPSSVICPLTSVFWYLVAGYESFEFGIGNAECGI
jgi:hypothetical protein